MKSELEMKKKNRTKVKSNL